MCLAQEHNAVRPARLDPTASRSRVKHTTTEPLHSLSKSPYNLSLIGPVVSEKMFENVDRWTDDGWATDVQSSDW